MLAFFKGALCFVHGGSHFQKPRFLNLCFDLIGQVGCERAGSGTVGENVRAGEGHIMDKINGCLMFLFRLTRESTNNIRCYCDFGDRIAGNLNFFHERFGVVAASHALEYTPGAALQAHVQVAAESMTISFP